MSMNSYGFTGNHFRVELDCGKIKIIPFNQVLSENIKQKIIDVMQQVKDFNNLEVEECMNFNRELKKISKELTESL